jgi:hypothetical protein
MAVIRDGQNRELLALGVSAWGRKKIGRDFRERVIADLVVSVEIAMGRKSSRRSVWRSSAKLRCTYTMAWLQFCA